jgi:hypothetical protein
MDELMEPRRVKVIARSYANVYLRRGKIMRRPCERCGSPDAEMHHDDYSKPLEVRWLCRDHHNLLHDQGHEPKVPPRHPKHRLTPRKARAA